MSDVSVFIPHFLCLPSFNHGILRKLHTEWRLSARSIVDLSGGVWAKTSISQALRKHQLTKPSHAQQTPTFHRRYGKTLLKGKLVDHKGEQRIIEQMLELKSQGKSSYQIAKHLNSKKIKSKTGGLWTYPTVTVIIKRETQEELS